MLTNCKAEYYNINKKKEKGHEMITSSVIDLRIVVENYIKITNFNDLSIKTKNNPILLATFVGCIEGIIAPCEDKDYFTIFEMEKKEFQSEYMFSEIYMLIRENKNYFNHIVKYFNMWHGKDVEIFEYDDYHIQDIMNNFFKLKLCLVDEYNLAKKNNDKSTIELYEQSLRLLAILIC